MKAGAISATTATASQWRHIALLAGTLFGLATLALIVLRSESPLLLRVVVIAGALVGIGVLSQQLHRLWETLRAYQLAMTAAHDGFWEWDPVSKRLQVSPRLLEILGYSENFLPDTHAWLQLLHPEDREQYNRTVAAHLKGKTPHFYCEYRVRGHDGDYRWITSRGIAVRDRHGRAYHMAGSVTDITARKRHEEEIAWLAGHDQLTGLPNRFALSALLSAQLATARAHDHRLAVLFIDLDRFKNINDALGHSLGDSLLRAVASRLGKALDERATLIRHGGDEFIVLLYDTGAELATQRAQQLLELLETPFRIGSHQLHVGASIGLSIFPDDAENAEALLRNADTAMYEAKRIGGGRIRQHTPRMKELARERNSIEHRLHDALARQEFRLVYQPQFDLADNRLVGAEVLLRWQAGQELIPPDRFIGIAEDTGLIVPIGYWVVDTALAQLAEWRRQQPQLRLAVNLSPRQFWESDLAERIAGSLAKHQLPASALELEVTESLLLDDGNGHGTILQTLRQQGITLALDDFGTGYSALSYLRRLPFSVLKIDRAFTADLSETPEGDSGSLPLVRAIVAMAHSLDMKVIAEGVETSAQRKLLQELDCDIYQGYLGGHPCCPDEFTENWLKTAGGSQGARAR